MKKIRPYAAILTCAYIILVGFAAIDCQAQAARAIEQPKEGYFSLEKDTRLYQIINRYQDDKAYVSYSKAVREKIKKKLVENYRDYYKDGEVYILFIIKANGKLRAFGIDYDKSTDDKKLLDVAAASLKESSPFPPFPETLDTEQLPFSIELSFKKR